MRKIGLQGGKVKIPIWISFDYPLDKPLTEITYSVKEDNGLIRMSLCTFHLLICEEQFV